jgi:hypothetical protein
MSPNTITSSPKSVTRKTLRKRNEFWENVHLAIEKKGWTQKDLAEESQAVKGCSVSENTVGKIKMGKRHRAKSRENIKKVISLALGCEYPWTQDTEILTEENVKRFILESQLVKDLDDKLAAAYGVGLVLPDSYLRTLVQRLSHIQITKKAELRQALVSREDFTLKFGRCCARQKILRLAHFMQGLCIFVMQLGIMAERNGTSELGEYLKEYRINKPLDPLKMAKAFHKAYDQAFRK